jgi:hypothetical protein
MTTTPKPKKAEGIIIEINPTNVVIGDTLTMKDKTIYLPPDKRTYFNSQMYKSGDNVRLMYDRDGNYIDSERLPKRDLTKSELEKIDHVVGSGGGESHTAFEPEHPEIHIQQEIAMGPKDRANPPTTETIKVENVHIQKETDKPQQTLEFPSTGTRVAPAQQPHWMTDREKNETTLIQSVLARAVDIVNAQYRDYPEVGYGDFTVEELLKTRTNHIEHVTDRLYAYVKKKVKE